MIYRSNIVVPTTSPLTFIDGLTNLTLYPPKEIQRFGSTSTVHMQFMSSNDLADTFKLKCLHAVYDIQIAEVTFTKSTLSTGYYYWDAYFPCSTILTALTALGIHYLEPYVYFRIESDVALYMDSQPVYIGSWSEMTTITYHNSRNDYKTVFGTFNLNNAFTVCVRGGFGRGYYNSGGVWETFANQKRERQVVYSIPDNQYTLTIIDLSDMMAEKLNAIFHLDTILIGGLQYYREGEISQSLQENKLIQYEIKLTPAANRMTQNFESGVQLTTQDGTLITDELTNILTIGAEV